MADTTYTLILSNPGIQAFTVPEGFWPDITIHCWGAGGGTSWGGLRGGGGGYSTTSIDVNVGDEISLQAGRQGRNATGSTSGGSGGRDETYLKFRGGSGGSTNRADGGGGAASWVAINGEFVCVAAGGGGGDDTRVGMPGGIFSGVATGIYAVTLSYAWNSFMNNYAVWGAGQDYTTVINFPTTGTYTFKYAVDNTGIVQLDGSTIISYTGFSTTTTYTATVSAGNHTIRVTGVNFGGPAGVAAQILNPNSTELWNTRNLINTNGLSIDSRGGDSSNGGGGGGGYPFGGEGGRASPGAGGQNFGNVTISGAGSTAGGTSVAVYPGDKIGEAGYPGYVAIVFRKKLQLSIKNADSSGDWTRVAAAYVKTPPKSVTTTGPDPITVVTDVGGWKAIDQAFVKVNNAWKPILGVRNIDLYGFPVQRLTANIVISSDTTGYDLLNNLPITYYPGIMDIDVWVLPGVAITGNNASTAFSINNFDSRDRITLHNYGIIQGKGGTGGVGGSTYSQPTNSKTGGGVGKVSTRTSTSPPGRGGNGGTGLFLGSPVTVLNSGVIAGGGGGGGGGGATGSQGGGGAGYGLGFNNGTLTSAGAGGTSGNDGGTGGARGRTGNSGQNGAPGGSAGAAINGATRLVPGSNVGAYFGPLIQ